MSTPSVLTQRVCTLRLNIIEMIVINVYSYYGLFLYPVLLKQDVDSMMCFVSVIVHLNGTLKQYMQQAVMASAAPPKRMVSSVFITLASPYRATVTQQQPTLQAHSAPARDKQHTAVRVSPSDSLPSPRPKKEDHSSSESNSSVDRTHAGAQDRTSDTPCPKTVHHGPSRGKLQEDDRGSTGIYDKI